SFSISGIASAGSKPLNASGQMRQASVVTRSKSPGPIGKIRFSPMDDLLQSLLQKTKRFHAGLTLLILLLLHMVTGLDSRAAS
ncbi:hypothetical protein, partial [Microvirga sp. P5_D2]